MTDLTPRKPYRPLTWPDVVLDLQELLLDVDQPVYIVGGAVRDALLSRPLTDLDLATPDNGIQLARRIANALDGDFFVMDAERDVGRALIDTQDGRFVIDVARFRGDDLYSDLFDRDFTVNAMAVDLKGAIDLLIDPMNGQRDLKAKLIRRCNPHSIMDDPLRMLRAVRQSVQLDMRIEPETLADIRATATGFSDVSAERVRDEFVKLLALPKARMALRVTGILGLLEPILPEAISLSELPATSAEHGTRWQETLSVVEALSHLLIAISPLRSDHTAASFGLGMLIMQLDRFRSQLQAHIGHHWPNERPHTALLVLAALLINVLQDQPNAVEMVGERARVLRLSNDERHRMVAIAGSHHLPFAMQDMSPLAVHRFWRQTGDAGVDVCLLAAAVFLGRAGSDLDQDEWLAFVERLVILLSAYFDQYESLVEPPLLVDGNQLMGTLGLEPGPLIGDLLDHIREAQVTGDVHSVEDAFRVGKAYLNGRAQR